MLTCYTVSTSEMANKAKPTPTQREVRLLKLVTPEGKRHAITASSYEEFAVGGKHCSFTFPC